MLEVDGRTAICSGLVVEGSRSWEIAGPEVLLKQCQACFNEMMRRTFSAKSEVSKS